MAGGMKVIVLSALLLLAGCVPVKFVQDKAPEPEYHSFKFTGVYWWHDDKNAVTVYVGSSGGVFVLRDK